MAARLSRQIVNTMGTRVATEVRTPQFIRDVNMPEVQTLADLLQYQDGSIVSRVLLKNNGGTVTLFAFDEEEGLSEHTAPFDALVVVLDGNAHVEISGKGYEVSTGETILLPANQPHAVKATTRFKMLLTMIRA